MKALIFGAAGQDGSYLSEYLISLGYEVHGVIRRNSIPEHQESRLHGLDIITHYGDVMDTGSIERLFSTIKPDEVYNLAAQSHVRISFDIPEATVQYNAIGVLNLLEAVRRHPCKFYQASSSEMFGNSVDSDGFQRITTPMHPVSPYGCAKLFAFNICKTYRESYGLPIYNGILFNHESPRRGSNFVTTKVVKGAVKAYNYEFKVTDLDNWRSDNFPTLELGNMDSYRDWGHSKDYVRAMHLIMQQEPCDMVVSTGETHSVREMCEYVFSKLGLDYEKYVVQNPRYLRPNELKYLKGDSTPIRQLGWQPKYSFETLMDEMIRWMQSIH